MIHCLVALSTLSVAPVLEYIDGDTAGGGEREGRGYGVDEDP